MDISGFFEIPDIISLLLPVSIVALIAATISSLTSCLNFSFASTIGLTFSYNSLVLLISLVVSAGIVGGSSAGGRAASFRAGAASFRAAAGSGVSTGVSTTGAASFRAGAAAG